jgi:hypothetical protein
MTVTQIETAVNRFVRVFDANQTASSYTAPTDMLALPTFDGTTGYVDMAAGRPLSTSGPGTAMLKFFAAGADGNTGNFRVYGLREVRDYAGTTVSYTHTLLAEFAFTVTSGDTGVANGVVTATGLYASTVTEVVGNANVSDSVISPTGTVAGHALLDTKGHRYLLFAPKKGTATSINVLVAGL